MTTQKTVRKYKERLGNLSTLASDALTQLESVRPRAMGFKELIDEALPGLEKLVAFLRSFKDLDLSGDTLRKFKEQTDDMLLGLPDAEEPKAEAEEPKAE